MKRQAILKITVNEMLQHGTSCISLQHIQARTGIPQKTLQSLFPRGDKELLLDAMEYSGQQWVQNIQTTLRAMQDQRSKVEFLVDSYCLGTLKHAPALDTYLDMWNVIRDTGDEYLRCATLHRFIKCTSPHFSRSLRKNLTPRPQTMSCKGLRCSRRF